MKKFARIALFCLGLVEIGFGGLLAPIRIYAATPALAKAMALQNLPVEQRKHYYQLMSKLQSDWTVVAGFGVLTVVAAIILGPEPASPKVPKPERSAPGNAGQPAVEPADSGR